MAQETKKQENVMNVEETLNKSEAFILNNKKTILGCIIAAVVIFAGVWAYGEFVSAPREKSASEALFKAEQYFNADNYEQALNGDSLGCIGFIAVAEDFSGTDAANLANAYAGLSLVQLNRYEEAVPYLKEFRGDDAMVAPAVLGALGNCYAQLGQNEKAASTLIDAAEKASNNSLSPLFLMQAGEIYESLGKSDDALKAYNKIKNEYPRTMQAHEVEKFIERATAGK